jgi:two-component system sensor histidine kinase UhpB
MPLKLRLNIALGLVLALAIASMVGALLIDAGPRLQNEIASSVRVTEGVVRSSIEALETSPHPEEALVGLVAGLKNQRHVVVTLATRMPERGNVIPADRKPGATIPSWVRAADPPVIRVPVEVKGRDLGTIIITGDGSDEMREVWETIGRIALYGSIFSVFAFAVTSWLIRSSLQPIDKLHDAITHLESGDYDVDVPTGGTPEIAGISAHINALAAALSRARDENRRLSTAIVRVQDEERREIARELHDELGPHLFSLRASGAALAGQIGKGQIDPARIKADVQTMIDRTNVLQQTNRRVLQRLSPAGLAELGLARAITALAETWRSDQPETALSLHIDGDIDQLDPTASLTVYRVVQEALMNAYRHARATEIAAEVTTSGGPAPRIAISVRDNGDGMSHVPEDGFGLRGMRERIAALGGQIEISPSDAGGTHLTASIPIAAR